MTRHPYAVVFPELKRRQKEATDNDSIASESIYTEGGDEFHTDDMSVISNGGFTNIEISFQNKSKI